MDDATPALEHGDGDPHDPWDRGRSGYSLANNRELVFGCLDAVAAESVLEIGAEHGLFTRELLAWAAPDGRVAAVDPSPRPPLVELAKSDGRLELIERTSIEALAELPRFDAYIVDGDHNWFTVSSELRAIEAAAGGSMPLVLFHDVCWPHARRDAYYAPERIPEEHRQPLARDIRVVPWERGSRTDHIGFPAPCVAAQEGGPRNGVLTAIEDFLEGREDLRFARVPLFFGFAALWPADHPQADAIAGIVQPLAEHPVLARAEANRVIQLIERLRLDAEIDRADGEKLAWLESEVRPMLDSRALGLAERLSGLRSDRPAISRRRLREILDRDY